MSSIKTLLTGVFAAAFVFIGGCGDSGMQGETDDSQVSDQVPGTTQGAGDTTGMPETYDDPTGAPGDAVGSPGAGTDPNMAPDQTGATYPQGSTDPQPMDPQSDTQGDTMGQGEQDTPRQ